MGLMMLDKPAKEAAEAMLARIENGALEEKTEERDGKLVRRSYEVVGDFHVFSLRDVDLWGGRMKFVFNEKHEPAEALPSDWLLSIAQQAPDVFQLMTSEATMQVFRQVTLKKTITTRTERWIDGRRTGLPKEEKQEEETETWEDVTREFAQMAQYEDMMRERRS